VDRVFHGLPEGLDVDGGESLYTASICLTEVKARYLRKGRDPKAELEFMSERGFILPLDKETSLLAAEIKQSRGLHTMDAVVYATAQWRKLTVVTGDQHFEGLPGVEMI
jgi:predicted nucleic acid-binding protein